MNNMRKMPLMDIRSPFNSSGYMDNVTQKPLSRKAFETRMKECGISYRDLLNADYTMNADAKSSLLADLNVTSIMH